MKSTDPSGKAVPTKAGTASTMGRSSLSLSWILSSAGFALVPPALSLVDIDTRSMPLDNSSMFVAHREFVVQHPAIFPISPSHSRYCLKGLSRGDRLPPPLYESFDVFWMNNGG